MSARLAAYRLIEKVENSAYSNLALDSAFKDSGLSPQDKAFAARLFYGVTERRITLDHIISAYVKKGAKGLDRQVRIALEEGLYQLLYMDVPDSAAVNESVRLTKSLGKASACGLVNAVLRSFIRDKKRIPQATGGKYDKMSVEYSCPAELIKRICEGYGEDNARLLLDLSLKPPVTAVRVNTLLTDKAALAASLAGRGISVSEAAKVENALICTGLSDIENDPDFLKGNFHVQDISSQLCCMAVAPQAGDTVIDICAAPGGKSFTMAQLMGDKGMIYACELHEKRTRLIEQGAKRLKTDCIKCMTHDAVVKNESLPLADRVLCDVPCSGYGVIRGKPEIKYKPLSDAESLPKTQLAILKAAAGYVKDGGVLVYSTCTVNIMENERVVEEFLQSEPAFCGDEFPAAMGADFSGRFCKTIFSDNCDGFFICRMRKGNLNGKD